MCSRARCVFGEVGREQQHAARLSERDQLFAVVMPRRTLAALPESDCMTGYLNRGCDLGAGHSGLPEACDGFHGYEP